jgi:DNA repair proteins
LANSASIIVAHNHPSGDIAPSKEDKMVNAKLLEASKIMDIKLLDSLIVGPTEKYWSMQEA